MGIYKLNKGAGSHIGNNKDGIEVQVEPGQKIETDSDLIAAFPNKFTRLDNVLEEDQAQGFAQPTIPVPGRFIKNNETPPAGMPPADMCDNEAEIGE